MTAPETPARAHLIVRGIGPAAHGALAELAFRLATVARAMRFDRVRVIVSRVPGSDSRYLFMDDARGRTWKIRISNHRRPNDAPTPHLDLVSRDGVAGFEAVTAFLQRVAVGEVEWFDETTTGRMLSRRQRERWGRR